MSGLTKKQQASRIRTDALLEIAQLPGGAHVEQARSIAREALASLTDPLPPDDPRELARRAIANAERMRHE